MNIGKLMAVAVAGDHRLALEWDDGRTAMVDLSEVVGARKALAPLANPVAFAGVALASDGWSAEWPKARSGGIDFGAQQLRRWADEQAGQTMPPAAFRLWMETHAFTLDRAAEALGLSRRTIAYYLSGEHVLPKTVMLATEGLDRRMVA